MKMVKTIVSVLTLSAMTLSLAACGGSPSTASVESSSQPESSSSVVSSSVPESSSSDESSSVPESSSSDESSSAPESASSDESSSVSEDASAPTGASLTEEEYMKEMEKVGTAMMDLQSSASNATDVDGAKKLLEDMKTQFNNMAQLNAPDKYKDAQAKIKSGSEAMVKYIDMALKAADGTELSTDDQSKMAEYINTAMTDLQAGMTAVQ